MPFDKTPSLYSVWQGMKRRCLNPKAKYWDYYGGRGISICAEWSDYKTFEKDMGPRPPGMSLDRIDNDGNYEPSNCRWATKKEQQRNQRRAVYVEIEGKRYRAIELAEIAEKKTDTIVARAAAGLPYEKVVAKEEFPFMGGWRKAVAVRVRNQREATHCKNGHQWSEENTAFSPEGWKRCRECARLKMRRITAAKREKRLG